MGAVDLITSIGVGVFLILVGYFGLGRFTQLNAKTRSAILAMLVLLVYVPQGILKWPGADIFAIHLAIYLTTCYGLGLIGSREGSGWHWAPAIIVTFFVCVIVINIVFVSVAEKGITGVFAELLPAPRSSEVADSRFPGTVSHDFQEKEALYNAYLEDVEAQKQRGWQVRKGWHVKPVVGEEAVFIVFAQDKQGNPIVDAQVSGTFLRTSNSRQDFSFNMINIGGGEYRLTTIMEFPGLWQLVLRVKRGSDVHEVRGMTSVLDRGVIGERTTN